MFQKLPENTKMVLSAVLPTLAIVILSAILAQVGLGKVSDLRSSLSASRRNVTVLTEKLNVLASVQSDALNSASTVSLVLPDSNPSLTVLSQLKNLSIQNGVTLSSIKSGAEIQDTSGLSRADITFDVLGGRGGVIAFIRGISTFAPISVVDQIKLNETNAGTRASVSVRTYWSSLPTQLPPLTQSVTRLTQAEMETITELETLTKPQFAALTPVEGGKVDPFTP